MQNRHKNTKLFLNKYFAKIFEFERRLNYGTYP
jgi:hypothetical protein